MFSYIQTQIKLLCAKINHNFFNIYFNNFNILNYIENNDIESVKTKLDNGYDIHKRFKYNNTLLSFCVVFSHYEIAEYLIEKGSDVNVVLDSGDNLITDICIYPKYENLPNNDENIKIVKLLINNGCNVNHKNGKKQTPLVNAIKNENYEICEYLIKYGADVNFEDPYSSQTPLHFAIMRFSKCYDNTRYININYYNVFRLNQLYKIAVLLIENGADVLKRDRKLRLCTYFFNNMNGIEWFDNIPNYDIDIELKHAIHSIKNKMITYVKEQIQERELLTQSFKRARIDTSEDTDEDDRELDEI